MATEYDLDDAPNFRCVFAVSDVPTDPTTVSLTVIPPSKTATVYTFPSGITRESEGQFAKQVTLDERGIWYYRWAGTGDCQASTEGTIIVRF